MAKLNEFTCFALLPQELQDEVWSQSLEPQLISLHYINLKQNIAARLSEVHFPTAGFRRLSPSSAKQLEVINTSAPLAFRICQASRAVALSKGYTTWRINHLNGKVRDLLWDPRIDKVVFKGQMQSRYPYSIFFEY